VRLIKGGIAMLKENILKDITESAVEQVVGDFKKAKCQNVTKEQQPNGKWTVKAMCPDKKSK
jgi:hypothetical protein